MMLLVSRLSLLILILMSVHAMSETGDEAPPVSLLYVSLLLASQSLPLSL